MGKAETKASDDMSISVGHIYKIYITDKNNLRNQQLLP